MFLGIDLGGTNTKLGVCEGNGTVVACTQIETKPEQGPEAWIQRVVGETKKWGPVSAVGIGSPGPLDTRTGTIIVTPNLKSFEGFSLREGFAKHIKEPIYFENDANCGALAEYHFGAHRGCNHMTVLTLGTGLGSGAIVEGHLLRGAGGLAAELGHVVLDSTRFLQNNFDEPPGMMGTMEEVIGAHLVVDRWNQDHPQQRLVGLRELFDLAARNNREAKESVTSWTTSLSLVLYNTIVTFNPSVIVLSGGVTGAWAQIQPALVKNLQRWVPAPMMSQVKIEVSQLRENFGVLGAVALAKSEMGKRG